jgi:hypothetical protein
VDPPPPPIGFGNDIQPGELLVGVGAVFPIDVLAMNMAMMPVLSSVEDRTSSYKQYILFIVGVTKAHCMAYFRHC